MPAWLIPLLIQVLTDFLEWLFNRVQPTPPQLSLHREQFLSRVSWRVWYGKNRMQIAGQLFDKAVEKYHTNGSPCFIMLNLKQYAECADYLCKDLTLN